MMSAEMPERPRQHELETESYLAFRGLLPSSWVVRSVSNEYGIDLEVEIFEGGRATGDVFKVQLKGTDKRSNKDGSFSFPIDAEKFTYWDRLDTPVLVVLYTASNGSVYARWAQSYDPYFARKKDAKTITLRFRKGDLCIRGVFPDVIAKQLRVMRALRERRARLPIPVVLHIPARLHDRDRAEILARLRIDMAPARNVVVIANGEASEDLPRISFDADQICVSMPGGIASATLHHDRKAYTKVGGFAKLSGDAMVLMGRFLLQVGMPLAGAELIDRFHHLSFTSEYPNIADDIVQRLLGQGLLNEAWGVIEAAFLSSNSDLRRISDLWVAQLITHDKAYTLSRDSLQRVITSFQARAEQCPDDEAQAAGRLHYSAGKIYELLGDQEGMLASFLKAAELDPGYLRRGYYLSELAGLRFGRGDYSEAVAQYREAVAIGDVPTAPFLLADALMHAGRYAESASVDFETGTMAPEYQAGARVLRLVIDTVVRFTEIDSQDRRPIPEDAAQAIDENATEEQLLGALREWDALNPAIWHNLAFHQTNPMDAFSCLLVAAKVREDSAKAWAVTLSVAISAQLPEAVVKAICSNAFRFAKDGLFEAADEIASLEGAGGVEDIRPILYSFAEEDPAPPSRVVRVVGDEDYFTFDMNSHDDRMAFGVFGLLQRMPREFFDSLEQRVASPEQVRGNLQSGQTE